jgi:hypothetical protein
LCLVGTAEKNARRVLCLHATSAAADRTWSAWGSQFPSNRARMDALTGMRAIRVQVNSRRVHDQADRDMGLMPNKAGG